MQLFEGYLLGCLSAEVAVGFADAGPFLKQFPKLGTINVVLDPLLIFGLGMGVAGAALATTISITFAAVYLVAVSSRNGLSVTPPWSVLNARRRVIGEITRIGGSRTLSLLSLSFGFMCLNKLVSSISEVAMTAWTLCGRLDQLILSVTR